MEDKLQKYLQGSKYQKNVGGLHEQKCTSEASHFWSKGKHNLKSWKMKQDGLAWVFWVLKMLETVHDMRDQRMLEEDTETTFHWHICKDANTPS